MAKRLIGPIGFCGLHCGDCFAYSGTIADMARDLRKALRQARFEKTAKALSHVSFFKVFERYPDCYEVLGAMVKFRCRNGCRLGGGNPSCKIRKCCNRKDLDGCWQCDEFESCDKLTVLEEAHGIAHLRNLKRLKLHGPGKFHNGKIDWYAKKPSK